MSEQCYKMKTNSATKISEVEKCDCGGSGSEPENYLKSASVVGNNETLNIETNKGVQVSFTPAKPETYLVSGTNDSNEQLTLEDNKGNIIDFDLKPLVQKVEANTIEITSLDNRTSALEDELAEQQKAKSITTFDYVPADSNKKLRKFYNGSIVGNQLFITIELYDNTVNTTTSGYIKHGTLPDKVVDNLGNEYEIVISANMLNPCLIRLSTGVFTETFINLINTDKSLNIFCTSAMNNAKFSNIIIQTTLTLKKVIV